MSSIKGVDKSPYGMNYIHRNSGSRRRQESRFKIEPEVGVFFSFCAHRTCLMLQPPPGAFRITVA